MNNCCKKEDGIDCTLVTKPKQLNDIEGLIIPGGESTVILKLIKKYGFIEPLKKFSKIKSIFGTCAGAIVISNSTADNMHTLDFINVRTNRNYWGRQINSFPDNVKLNLAGSATEGVDYNVDSMTITIPKGSISGNFKINSINDLIDDNSEVINVNSNNYVNWSSIKIQGKT